MHRPWSIDYKVQRTYPLSALLHERFLTGYRMNRMLSRQEMTCNPAGGKATMNITTLNNLDGDVWKMILENLAAIESQEERSPVLPGAGSSVPQAPKPDQSVSRETR